MDPNLRPYVPKECPPDKAVAWQGFCIRAWSSANGTIHDLRIRSFAQEWIAGNIENRKKTLRRTLRVYLSCGEDLDDALVLAIEKTAVINAIAEFEES